MFDFLSTLMVIFLIVYLFCESNIFQNRTIDKLHFILKIYRSYLSIRLKLIDISIFVSVKSHETCLYLLPNYASFKTEKNLINDI